MDKEVLIGIPTGYSTIVREQETGVVDDVSTRVWNTQRKLELSRPPFKLAVEFNTYVIYHDRIRIFYTLRRTEEHLSYKDIVRAVDKGRVSVRVLYVVVLDVLLSSHRKSRSIGKRERGRQWTCLKQKIETAQGGLESLGLRQ
jgi:hypothetical protein